MFDRYRPDSDPSEVQDPDAVERHAATLRFCMPLSSFGESDFCVVSAQNLTVMFSRARRGTRDLNRTLAQLGQRPQVSQLSTEPWVLHLSPKVPCRELFAERDVFYRMTRREQHPVGYRPHEELVFRFGRYVLLHLPLYGSELLDGLLLAPRRCGYVPFIPVDQLNPVWSDPFFRHPGSETGESPRIHE